MDPISAVSTGSANASSALRPASDRAVVGGQVGANQAIGGSSMQAIGQVFSEVTDLLRSIGGGVENDKLLRMLVALMIIMALLDRGSGTGDSTQGAGAPLDAGGDGRSQYVGIFSSSTTISIQQTSTTVVMGAGAEGFDASDGGDASGGRLDVAG